MTLDALLAIAHHLAAFGLLGALAAEWALVQPGLTAASISHLARVDRAYGLLAATVVAAGVARMAFGAVEASFLVANPLFWAKMTAFAAVALLSIRPTLAYLRWSRASVNDRSWQPPAAEVDSARRVITLQLALFPLIPAFAALVARGIGL